MVKPLKPDDPQHTEVLGLEAVQQLAAAVAPFELSADDRARLEARIMASIAEDAPEGTFTNRAADMKWVQAGPGVQVKILRMDRERRDQTVLIRMEPGSLVVGHRHSQEEECLVLEGEVFIGTHHLREGDMHVATPGVRHDPIRAPLGALVLIRSEMPPDHFKIA